MSPTKKRKPLFERAVALLNHFIRSSKNFFKSSFLSLLVVIIILLLLTKMAQAFTMMVDLVENDWVALLFSFFFINALALVLSHYPIYNYYAADLNNSGDYTKWAPKKPLPKLFGPLHNFTVYVFTKNPASTYVPDNLAHYFRYFIGILIHIVWIHFILQSFMPNLIFEDNFSSLPWNLTVYPLLFIPFIIYIYLKQTITKYERNTRLAIQENTLKRKEEFEDKLDALLKRLGVYYTIAATCCVVLLSITLIIKEFSLLKLLLMLFTSYAFMFNYVFFRLLRSKLPRICSVFERSSKKSLFKPILKWLMPLAISEKYLLIYFFNFIVASVIIIWSMVASSNGGALLNGIPIILAFFYFYYYIIASVNKFFFVTKKLYLFGTTTYKILFGTFILVILLGAIGLFFDNEMTTHQLDTVAKIENPIQENEFIDKISSKSDSTLFFIASHGGGLKANVWTLKVVNMLQTKTNGKLLDQTVALSGASGGSLGLALYTGLYWQDGVDTTKINQKINTLAKQNYTSLDLSLTLGIDTYRKLWPLYKNIGLRDRPYHAMKKYQDHIENTYIDSLSGLSYRGYWKNAYQRAPNGYYPSLIMNTAGTHGGRGIFWSVASDRFQKIFPNSVNLADISEKTTVPYYQAVSTTNRFPFLSPAAKIKGYGHYIDAGAIDNSGLLGCLDLYQYLKADTTVLKGKKVVFIEISNGKSIYIKQLLKEFRKRIDSTHITIDETETDNIMADLQTGMNLDKIPNYLSDLSANLDDNDPNFGYVQLMMPHKISITDVENVLGGKIVDDHTYCELKKFLKEKNLEIIDLTDNKRQNLFSPWNSYEPTLSRHLSKSSLNYVDSILKHPYLKTRFNEISGYVTTKNDTL
tara:strand:+ start:115011 stop:117608 length:2598 start_codon:yes stop_codon:yes gene_type:complete